MFARTLIDSDSFLDMPLTARLLYYDLCMRADDDGFVNAPKNIMRSVGASQDDLTLLLMKNFLIPFDSGVVAVRHWRVHNYIRQDRYKATTCAKEKNQLRLNDSGVYELAAEVQNPLVDQLFVEVNPIPVKKAMELMGYCKKYIRLPLTEMEDEHTEKLKELLIRQGVL